MVRVFTLSSVLLLLIHGGCASVASERADRGTQVPVTNVGTVAGRWAGLSDLPGHRLDDQYVEVTFREDGTYEATSARTIGFMDRRGHMELSDGRLVLQGDSGARGTATLYSAGGQRTLLIEVATPRTGNITARLHPQP